MIATTTATVMATVTVRREDVVRDDAADGVRDAVGVGRPAALEAGTGEGDACSSYGNRNFSLIYTDWFGNPRQ